MKMWKVLMVVVVLAGLFVGAGCENRGSATVDADVLTINSEITEGKLIGHFLGSSDGWLKTDINKVGVKFIINGRLFLEDLKLSHAQLAYYKGKNTLPLKIAITSWGRAGPAPELVIRLNGYYIKRTYLSFPLALNLITYMKGEQE